MKRSGLDDESRFVYMGLVPGSYKIFSKEYSSVKYYRSFNKGIEIQINEKAHSYREAPEGDEKLSYGDWIKFEDHPLSDNKTSTGRP